MTLSSSSYETPEPEALKGESTLASGGEAGEQKFTEISRTWTIFTVDFQPLTRDAS